jgi:hypothetical protein
MDRQRPIEQHGRERRLKIYACIPTHNEAFTIASVTSLVDQGLALFCGGHPGAEVVIMNVDSASEDGTIDLFRETQTYYQKQSVTLPPPRGKGRNLVEFMRLAYAHGASHCVTIDADITSLTKDWITDLLTPVVSLEAEFVTPSYERSRFEASTTNHFAYPVTLASTGLHIRQPIGGEFAFSSRLLEIMMSCEFPSAALSYGIDIYLTLAAVTGGLQHQQVFLGKKIHRPSFQRLRDMFPQVASAALSFLRKTGITQLRRGATPMAINMTSTADFRHRQAAADMRFEAQSELRNTDVSSWSWVPNGHYVDKQDGLRSEEWVDILASWLRYGLANENANADLLGQQLLPFFVLRATEFWFRAETMTTREAEDEVVTQALAVHARLSQALD